MIRLRLSVLPLCVLCALVCQVIAAAAPPVGLAATPDRTRGGAGSAVTALDHGEAEPFDAGTCPSGWSCADIGSPVAAGDQSLVNSTWTITGAGIVAANSSADSFHYVWQSLTGDGAVSAQVTSQADVGDGSDQAGVMVRQSTDPSAPYYAVVITPQGGAYVLYRASQRGTGRAPLNLSHQTPLYLGIGRTSNTFTAYTSSDGMTWAPLTGSSVTIAMSNTALAGLVVDSAVNNVLSHATFDAVSVRTSALPPLPTTCPSRWSCGDLGAIWPGGQAVLNNTWTITGAGGLSVNSTTDTFHYAWQPLAGNGSLTVHVVSQANVSDGSDQAGVIIRQSSAADAPYYAVFVTPQGGAYVRYRASANAPAGQAINIFPPPAYLQIGRLGQTFTAYTSSDGATWAPLSGSSVTIAMSGSVLAGLFVASTDAGRLSNATFDAVQLSPSSGTIPWHPHHSVRLTDHLSASVDLADGHLDLSSSDLSLPARGPDLTLNHVWDSTLAQAGITSTAGQGWQSSLTQSMGGPLTGTVVYTDATGAVWPLAYTGAPTATAPYTQYIVPAGQPWQLTASTAGYTLSNILTGETQTFDAQGRYLADTDSYANSNTLSYTSTAAMPMTETNSGGRALSFYYNAQGLLSAAQSPLDRASGNAQGQLAAYGYNASSQITATAWGYLTRDQLLATYGYSGTQLVTVTTPYTQSTHAWVIGYDPQGRVSSLSSPVSGTLGQTGYTPAYTTTFSYTPGQTVVVEGDGTSAALALTYTLDAQGEPIAVQDGIGDTTQTTYDADHDVLTSQDGDGHLTQNFYQYTGAAGSGGIASVGQVTETLQPAISPDFQGNTLTPISTTHSYDPVTHDLSATVQYGLGALTLFGDDGHHSVVTTTQELGAYCANSPPPSDAARHVEPSGLLGRTRVRPAMNGCTLLDAWRASVNQYDAYGERTGVTDGRGVIVTSTVDGVLPTATLDPCPGSACASTYTHSYTYTAVGDLASASTPPLVTTQNGLTSTAPVTTSYGYDLDGNQSSVTSANGTTTTTSYDHLGRAASTTLPPVMLYTGQQAQPVETTGYDGDGNVVRQVDGNGDVTTSSDDPLGRLVATTSAVGGTTLYTYTATAKSQAQDPRGDVTTYGYDGAGRLIQSMDQLGDTTQTQYDQASNPLTVTTGTAGSVTQLDSRQYDALGRVVTETVSAPGQAALTTVTSYDLQGDPEQIERPNGDVVFNSYDDVGQLLATSLSPGLLTGGAGGLPAFTTYQYDFAGNVETQTDADQRVTTATYDGDNRVGQSVAISNGTTLTTTTNYDPDGTAITQTQQSQTGSGPVSTRVTTATVNAADWITSSGDGPAPGPGTGPGTGTPLVTAYQYDGAGQLRSQSVLTTTLPVTSVLNGDGLATAIGESVGATPPYTSAFGYTANDLPLTATLPGGPSSGIAEQFGYDGANRLTTQTLSGPLTATNVLTSTYQYAYNPASWTTALTSVVSGITTTQVYTHDAQGRLVGRSLPGITQSWSDDGNGNVLTATITTTTTTLTTTNAYAPAQANQLISSTTTGKPTVYFGYDQNGDTTSITTTAGLAVGLSYDAQERPITLTSGSVTATLSYNAAGERAGYSVTVGSTPYYAAQFSYRGSDGELGQAVIVSGTQAYTDTYLYTPEGAPLELIRQQNGMTSRYWYEEDGRGNVVALTDITGTVVDRYSYDAWGTLTSSSESVPQRLRYAGYWYDQEFGWYWVGIRYYDPPLGRWLAPDPSQQDGVRTYVYVDDDPVDRTDPSGLDENPPPVPAPTPSPQKPASPPAPTSTPSASRISAVAVGAFVTLYRAVSQEELNDILRYGDYGLAPSQSGKYFAYRAEDARIFAQGGRVTITRIRVPKWFIERFGYQFEDYGKIPAVHIEDEYLPDLYKLSGRPEIVEAEWVPPLKEQAPSSGDNVLTDLEQLLFGESEGDNGEEFLSRA